MSLSWMAWTPVTAAFFGVIAGLLVMMAVWEKLRPGGAPRHGVLRIDTTRGDRLFISLLAAAFIHLAWLGATDLSLWFATGISVVFGIAVFRWV